MNAAPSGRLGISILTLGPAIPERLDRSLRALAGSGLDVRIIHRFQGCEREGSIEEPLGDGVVRVSIRRRANLGFAAGHNANVRLLDGCVAVWLLNDDVEFDPDVPQRLMATLDQRATCIVVGPEVVPIEDGLDRARALARPHDVGVGWYRRAKGVVAQARSDRMRAGAANRADWTFVSGCAALWRRDSFLELGGFSEPLFLYHEDSDLAMRAVQTGRVSGAGGVVIAFCPDARVFHHEGSSGLRPERAAAAAIDRPPSRTGDRTVLFDYFDMRNGLYLIARHSRGITAPPAIVYFGFRTLRKLARPWLRRESHRRRKNLYALLGLRDGLRLVVGGWRGIDPSIRARIETLGRNPISAG